MMLKLSSLYRCNYKQVPTPLFGTTTTRVPTPSLDIASSSRPPNCVVLFVSFTLLEELMVHVCPPKVRIFLWRLVNDILPTLLSREDMSLAPTLALGVVHWISPTRVHLLQTDSANVAEHHPRGPYFSSIDLIHVGLYWVSVAQAL